jgi:hypothetical protein
MQPLIPSELITTRVWPASRLFLERLHKVAINLSAAVSLAALLATTQAAPALAESSPTPEVVVSEDLSVGEAPDPGTISALTQGPEKRGWAWAEPYFTIPVMTSAAGQYGAYFKTRVTLLNPTTRNFTINATLYGPIGRVKRVSIPIKAGQTLVWNDFLAEAFTYTGAGGVFFDGWFSPPGGSIDNQFLVTAEVYTDSPNGRYKTVVGNGTEWYWVETNYKAYNFGVTVSASERTNIGVFNHASEAIKVVAEVFDSNGQLIETVNFDLAKDAWNQKPLTAQVTNGTIKWKVLNGSAFLYAVTVDNQSNDGSLMAASYIVP